MFLSSKESQTSSGNKNDCATESDNERAVLCCHDSSSVLRNINVDSDSDMENDSKTNDSFIITSSLRSECFLIVTRALAITIQLLFEFIPNIFQMQILGYLSNGVFVLAAVGLARSFAMVVGLAQSWALTSGLFTLLPQCISVGKFEQISLHVQRAFYVTTFTCMVLCFFQFFAGDILVYFGQSPDFRDLINIYCRVYIPNVFLVVWLTIVQRVLQALDMNREILIAQAIGFLISYPLNYLLIVYLDWQAIGGAIAASIITAIMFIGVTIALIYRGYGYVFIPVPLRIIFARTGMIEYLSLSIPNLFQNALEFILMEIATILAGYIVFSYFAVSVTIIMNNIFNILVAFSLGICHSVNIRIGGHIGRGDISTAKKSATIGVFAFLFVSTVIATVLGIFAHKIPYMWTNNSVITSVSAIVILYAIIPLNFALIGMQLMAGIYRGLGKQEKSAMFVIIGYWMLSFPISLILLFAVKLRSNILYGSLVIWGSITAGNALGFISLVIYMWRSIDWKRAVFEARKRVEYSERYMEKL